MAASVMFDLVFQSLQDFDSDQTICDHQIGAINNKQLLTECATNIQRIRSLKSFHRSKVIAKSNSLSQASDIMKKVVSNTMKSNTVSKLATLRRLYKQRVDYDRRIRELVYEIYGEYGKTQTRLARRNAYLQVVGIINSIYALWYYCWERFSCRLTYELTTQFAVPHNARAVATNIATSCFLCPCVFQKEFSTICAILQSKGMQLGPNSSDNLSEAADMDSTRSVSALFDSVGAIVRFQFTHRSDPKNPSRQLVSSIGPNPAAAGSSAGTSPIPCFMVANTVSEFQLMFEALGGVYKLAQGSYGMGGSGAAKRRESGGACGSGGYDWMSALSCKHIKWLHIGSLQPAQSWDRVYSEQRRALQAGVPGVDDSDTGDAAAEGESSRLTEFANKMLLQYTSFTVNEHLYVCLEERYWTLKEQDAGAAGGFHSQVAGSSDLDSESAFQSKIIFQLLQDTYVSKSVVTAPSQTELAEMLQSQTLYVTGSTNKHKQGPGFSRDTARTEDPELSRARTTLSSYPDIIEAECSFPPGSGKEENVKAKLHFAVATVYSLAELHQARTGGSHRSELVPSAGLYSLSRFLGKLLGETPGEAGATPPPVYTSPSKVPDVESGPGASNAHCTDITLMAGLTELCINELLAQYQLIARHGSESPSLEDAAGEKLDADPTSAVSRPSSQARAALSAPKEQNTPQIRFEPSRPGFLNLLPDHIRHSTGTGTGSEQLRHTYALVGNPQNPFNQKQYFLVQLCRADTAVDPNPISDDSALMKKAVEFHTRGYSLGAEDGFGPGLFDSNSCSASCCLTMGAKSSFCFNTSVQACANATLGPQAGVRCVDEAVIERQEQALLKPLGLLSVDSTATGGSGAGGKGSKATNPNPKTAVDNDSAMLSSLCYWRTCQCEALPLNSPLCAHSGAFRLCRYHAELQFYLESRDDTPSLYQQLNKRSLATMSTHRSGDAAAQVWTDIKLKRVDSALAGIVPVAKVSSNSEVWKYLPKKPPKLSYSADNRDYKIIMAASTLLQELCSANAKLFTTLSSFINKTIDQEMKIKKRLYAVLSYVNSVIDGSGAAGEGLGSLALSPAKVGGTEGFALDFIGEKSTNPSAKKTKRKGSTSNTHAHADLQAGLPPAAPTQAHPEVAGELQQKCLNTVRLLRKKISMLMSSYLAKQSWTRWRVPDELHKHLGRLEEEYRMIFDVLSFERNNTNEITILSELGVYPSTECALIRKDLKAFNDQRAAAGRSSQAAVGSGTHSSGASESSSAAALQELLTEVKLAEKKNIILYTRRMEEAELRAIAEKKQSRKRDKEQKESRDPMNFANHSGRK